MNSSAPSDAVDAACNRLNQALGVLEAKVVELTKAYNQAQQVADDGRLLLSRQESLSISVRSLTEENKKLKHGIQDAELEKLGARRLNSDLFTQLESVIARVEELA